MKKYSFLMMLLVAVLVLASCSHAPSSQKLVPEDAVMVMRVDLLQAGEKSGLGEGGSDLVKRLKKELKHARMSDEMRDMAESIIDDPSQSGIDLTEPIYIYAALDKRGEPREAGIVGSVSSVSKLTELLNTLADENRHLDEVDETDGVKYFGQDEFYLFYNSDWFFAGHLEGDIDDQIATLKDRADGKGSLDGNEAYAQLCQKETIMQMLWMGSGIADIRDVKQIARNLPDGLEIEDFATIMDLGLGDGEMTITQEVIALSDEGKEWIEKFDSFFGDIDKTMVKYISDDGLAVLANVNGKQLGRLITSMLPMAEDSDDKETLEQIKDISNSLEGPMIMDMTDINESGTPIINAYISTKDQTLANTLGEAASYNEDFAELGMYDYVAPIDYNYVENDSVLNEWGDPTYERIPVLMRFGYRNNKTYFLVGNGQEPFNKPAHAFSTSRLKGKGFYASFNFNALKPLVKELGGTEGRVAKKLVNAFDYAEGYYDGNGKTIFRLTTKDKDSNPVRVLGDLIQEFAD